MSTQSDPTLDNTIDALDNAIMSRDTEEIKRLVNLFENHVKSDNAYLRQIVRDNKGNEFQMIDQ
jgi:hypothetical protein